MFTSSLQEEVSSETFNETFGGANLESWSFTSRSVENNQGSVSGTAVIDGETLNAAISLINNDGWKINGYDFAPQG